MIRKFLSAVSLAGLILVGFSARAQPTRMQSDAGKQSEPATKVRSRQGNIHREFRCILRCGGRGKSQRHDGVSSEPEHAGAGSGEGRDPGGCGNINPPKRGKIWP